MVKKTKKILIPNATSPRNIGDLAMLTSLLGMFRREKYNVVVHSIEPNLQKLGRVKVKKTIYDYAVWTAKSNRIKTQRMLFVLLGVILIKNEWLVSKLPSELRSILIDYIEADKIVFVGGGYLRSRKGLRQSLNFLMQLLPFYLASKVNNETIVCPISIGPFAYRWQQMLTSFVFKKLDLVTVRENFSKKLLKGNGVKNVVLSSDHALLIRLKKRYKKKSSKRIGFTIRDWGNFSKQSDLENVVAESLSTISKKFNLQIQPIVQVQAPRFGEDDSKATERVAQVLKVKKHKVLPTRKNTSLKAALNSYNSIDLLLGMRMHSNILAAIQGVPFVALAYEYKTTGIASQLGLGDFVADIETVNTSSLTKSLNIAYKQKGFLATKLKAKVKSIQEKEIETWNSLLNN